MGDDPASVEIISVIIDLAHRFNLQVVAEGIEGMDALQQLHERGCDIGQGFHLGRPMPAAAFGAGCASSTLPTEAGGGGRTRDPTSGLVHH